MSVDPFTAISDPNRRFLLEELRRAPKTVNELAAMLPVSRPAVSQHLKALLDNRLKNALHDIFFADFLAGAGFIDLVRCG